jgi:hypothetical protein
MKSSKRRVIASRANGARSRGPKTPEGKSRSSYNATRHGLLSNCVVLATESREAFETLLNQYVERFGPLDEIEFDMIEEMASCYWRLRRGWAIETELLNSGIEKQPPGSELARLATSFSELAVSPQLALLNRYESRLNRMYQRALTNLLLLRRLNFPNEPSPTFEHPAAQAANLLITGEAMPDLPHSLLSAQPGEHDIADPDSSAASPASANSDSSQQSGDIAIDQELRNGGD